MAEPTTTATFGQRGASKSAAAMAAPAWETPPRTPRAHNQFVAFLERVFLWLPGERAPGLPAVALALARGAVLPLGFLLTPLIVCMLSGVNPLGFLRDDHNSATFYILAPVSFSFALVQELNRYAFVRRADRTLRSLAIITAVQIAGALLLSHDRLYTSS